MYSRVNYTIVGIFVLIFGAGLVWFFFWLAKYGIQQEYDTYKLYMKESVAGLSKDSVVKLHGVDVGRVAEIRIDPKNIERVEVVLKIKDGIPIKEDMVAHMKMLGITGLLSVEIDGGTNAAKTLKSDDEHTPAIPTAPSWFNQTTEGIGDLTKDLSKVLSRTEMLLSKKNIDNFGKILENTEIMTRKVVTTLDEFNQTMASYKIELTHFNETFNEMGDDFGKISKNSITTLKSLQKATKHFDYLIVSAQKSLNRGDYNIKETFEPMLVDISILTEQLTDLGRELENNPNGLLFKSRRKRRGPGE